MSRLPCMVNSAQNLALIVFTFTEVVFVNDAQHLNWIGQLDTDLCDQTDNSAIKYSHGCFYRTRHFGLFFSVLTNKHENSRTLHFLNLSIIQRIQLLNSLAASSSVSRCTPHGQHDVAQKGIDDSVFEVRAQPELSFPLLNYSILQQLPCAGNSYSCSPVLEVSIGCGIGHITHNTNRILLWQTCHLCIWRLYNFIMLPMSPHTHRIIQGLSEEVCHSVLRCWTIIGEKNICSWVGNMLDNDYKLPTNGVKCRSLCRLISLCSEGLFWQNTWHMQSTGATMYSICHGYYLNPGQISMNGKYQGPFKGVLSLPLSCSKNLLNAQSSPASLHPFW